MTNLEIIARQAAEIIELRDKLAEAEETKQFWFDEAQKRIPAKPMTMQKTVHALAHAEIPRSADEI